MRDDNRRGQHGSVSPFGAKRNGNNGVRPEGMITTPVPIREIEEPIDLVAVQADDELINALSAGMSVSSPGVGGYDADDHVAAILAAWKAEVDATDIPELVDVELAAATIAAATRPKIGRMRHLAPVAAAAAVVVLAMGGLSVGSYAAKPGDALWEVSKVLYSERAKSVEAAARVEGLIDNAKRALLSGEPAKASQELQKAAGDIAVVRSEDGKENLAEVQTFLAAKAEETPQGEPVALDTPLRKDPTAKVPEAAKKPPPDPKPSTDPGTTKPDPTKPGTQATSGPGTGSQGGGTGTKPTPDPRLLTGPESTGSPTTSNPATPAPTTKPSGNGEGSPSSSTATPTATPEGGPSSTTPHSMGPGGSEGGRTPTADVDPTAPR